MFLCELYLCYINRLYTSWKWFILYGYIYQQNTDNILSPAGIEPGPSDCEASVLPLLHDEYTLRLTPTYKLTCYFYQCPMLIALSTPMYLICLACVSNCDSCTESTTCLACSSEYFMDPSRVCHGTYRYICCHFNKLVF